MGYQGPMGADPNVVDRVRKLFALAGSPNPHEAAQAAARAQALITQHRLEAYLAAVDALEEDPITDGRDEPLAVARRICTWKVVLASALAGANGCVAWVWARDPEAICVVGRSADRDVVRALWDALVKKVEWSSATAGPGRNRAWHEAFRVGVADAIAEQSSAGEADGRAAFDEAGLVRIDQRAAIHAETLERFVAERLGAGRGRGIRVDARAYARGKRVGAALGLPARGPVE